MYHEHFDHCDSVPKTGGFLRRSSFASKVFMLDSYLKADLETSKGIGYIQMLSRPHARRYLSILSVASATLLTIAIEPLFAARRATLPCLAGAVSSKEKKHPFWKKKSDKNLSLNDTLLRAPFSGWITARNVDRGSIVGNTVVGFSMIDTQMVKAAFAKI